MVMSLVVGGALITMICAALAYRKKEEIDDWLFELRETRRRKQNPDSATQVSRRPFQAPGHPATLPPLTETPSPLTATELLRLGEYVRAGQMFLALQQWDSAISAFRMAAARDRRFYVEVARISFERGDMEEGLKACFASEDFTTIAHGCRYAENWHRFLAHMLDSTLTEENLRQLHLDFWMEMTAQVQKQERFTAWLEKIAKEGGESAVAQKARDYIAGEPLPPIQESASKPLSHAG